MISKGNCASLIAELEGKPQCHTSDITRMSGSWQTGWDRTSLGAEGPSVGVWLVILQYVTCSRG
jgi:hypothetical protein